MHTHTQEMYKGKTDEEDIYVCTRKSKKETNDTQLNKKYHHHYTTTAATGQQQQLHSPPSVIFSTIICMCACKNKQTNVNLMEIFQFIQMAFIDNTIKIKMHSHRLIHT